MKLSQIERDDMTTIDIATQVKQIILQVANLAGKAPEDIDDAMPLFEEGLGLDSVDLLELVIALERKFGLKIRNDESGRKVLGCVATIVGALQQQSVPV